MQFEGARVHAAKANQPGLGIAPEAFNAVDVSMPLGKFVLAVIDAEMLSVTNINQAVVTTPAVRVDDAFEFDLATNNRLQRGFRAIRRTRPSKRTLVCPRRRVTTPRPSRTTSTARRPRIWPTTSATSTWLRATWSRPRRSSTTRPRKTWPSAWPSASARRSAPVPSRPCRPRA